MPDNVEVTVLGQRYEPGIALAFAWLLIVFRQIASLPLVDGCIKCIITILKPK
jgi:hypothetical protein